jgi:hypothetical protein
MLFIGLLFIEYPRIPNVSVMLFICTIAAPRSHPESLNPGNAHTFASNLGIYFFLWRISALKGVNDDLGRILLILGVTVLLVALVTSISSLLSLSVRVD